MKDFINTHGKDDRHDHLMSKSSLNEVIDAITKSGQSHQIEFLSIQPKEVIKESQFYYNRYPVEMELVASFQNLGKFIDNIEHLNETKISISNLDISRREEILPLIKSNLTLEIFLKNE